MTPWRRRLRLAGAILFAVVATAAALAFWFAVLSYDPPDHMLHPDTADRTYR